MLTQKELYSQLHYDEETGLFTWIKARQGIKKGSIAGHTTKNGYKQLVLNYKKYLIHRLAWFYVYGKWPEHFIDHINGNPLDNRICNLREATNSENNYNSRLPSNNNSGVKGVVLHKMSGKWQAQICVCKKNIYLGLFENFELAKDAVNKARQKYHKEFANDGI